MENWLQRTEMLIGSEKLKKLESKTIAIFGLGGVGSYATEAIVRAGIGRVILVDNDIVSVTNINRQLIATLDSVGKNKVDVAKERYLTINPKLIVEAKKEFFSTQSDILSSDLDYIIDAIDSVSSKIELIEQAKKKNIPIISCMGTGNKLDASKFKITDISKTSMCPLAKVIRKELKNRNIKNVKVLYSEEIPFQYDKDDNLTPASISFVPSVAGLLIAGEVIRDLMNN